MAVPAAFVIANLAWDTSSLTPPPAGRMQIAAPSGSSHRTPVVHTAWASPPATTAASRSRSGSRTMPPTCKRSYSRTNGMMLGAQPLVQAGPDCTGT
jgi:hypothetical protein